MKENFLVIDMGTQSVRISIVSKTGEIISMAKCRYDTPYFSSELGYCEQTPDYYLTQLVKVSKELSQRDPENFSSVMGLVFMSFRDTALLLDESKRPIRPAILWLDERMAEIPGMNNLKGYEKLLFRVIGMSDTVKYNSRRTISFWIKENEPENWAKMRYYVPLTCYFNYLMTGNLVVSSADCIGHYPVNFKRGKYFSKHHPKIDVFGIPLEALPPLVKPGEIIGFITDEFSALTDIPSGLPVYASASDKSCETLGDGVISKNVGAISLGTACTIDVVDSHYSEPERFLPSYPAPYAGAYDLELQVYRGLWMSKWYAENFGSSDQKRADAAGISYEEYMSTKIRDVSPGCDGLIVQPYWGPGLKRPNGKGSIIGFSYHHTRYHVYRAIIEGIGFALKEGLEEIIKKTRVMPEYLVCSGGGSRSDTFVQIMADIFNIPIYRPKNYETATIGGAMSGFLATGVYQSPEVACKNMCSLQDKFVPDANNARLYESIYENCYLKIYPSLSKLYSGWKSAFLTDEDER